MAQLIAHHDHCFLIRADSADDLRALAKKAGLKIATECNCGKCGMDSGQHGFIDGRDLLAQDERATDYSDLRSPTRPGGLYLVSQFGHFDVADDSMLAAVCRPGLIGRRKKTVYFQIGLHYLTGKSLPAPAYKLIRTLQD
jgi:hypothetical protein